MSLSNTFFLFGEIITDQYCWNQNIREIACPSVSNLVDVCSVNDKSLAWPCQEKHIQFDHCKGWLGYKGWQSVYLGYFPHIPEKELASYKGTAVPVTPVMARPRWNCDVGHGCLWMLFPPFLGGISCWPVDTQDQYIDILSDVSLCKHDSLDFFQSQILVCFLLWPSRLDLLKWGIYNFERLAHGSI